MSRIKTKYIENNAVTNPKLAQMAAHTYKGNNTGSASDPIDVTNTQLTADLNLFTTSLQGLAPASGGGTVNFLRADATWQEVVTPAGVQTLANKTLSGAAILTSSLFKDVSDITKTLQISTSGNTTGKKLTLASNQTTDQILSIPNITGTGDFLVTINETQTLQSKTMSLTAGSNTFGGFTSGSVVYHNGTTFAQDNANFFWNATNKRLGIGTAAPADLLHLSGSGDAALSIESTGASGRRWRLQTDAATGIFKIRDQSIGTNPIIIESAAPTNSIYVKATSGNVGIGVSPLNRLHVKDDTAPPVLIERDQAIDGNAIILRQQNTTDGNALSITYQSDTTGAGAQANTPFADIRFKANVHDHATRAGSILFGTSQGGVGDVQERMRINASGNVGIGTGAPTSSNIVRFLHIANTTSAGIVMENTTATAQRYSIYASSGKNLIFQDETAGVARMQFNDVTGNLSIGNSNDSFFVDASKAGAGVDLTFKMGNSSNTAGSGMRAIVQVGSSSPDSDSAGDPRLVLSVAAVQEWNLGIDNSDANKFMIGTDSTVGTSPKLIISVGGNVGIGLSPTYRLDVSKSSTTEFIARVQNASTDTASDAIPAFNLVKGSTTNTAGTNRFIEFDINAGATGSGYISSNGANAVAFFNSSDARLKTNIVDLENALDTIMALQPRTFTWINNNENSVGFIAQEMVNVLPRQVHQTDDGTGESLPEGTEAWSITESGMVPYLVKALQELKAQFDAYVATHP